jgi:hypothetical protein
MDGILASNRDGILIEQVADALATRNPGYAEGLSDEMLVAFEPSEARQSYVRMQELLVDLRLVERNRLGRVLGETIEQVRTTAGGFSYRAAWFESRPDVVFVMGSAKNCERSEVLRRSLVLMRAALAFYEKKTSLVVIECDGRYEIALSRPGVAVDANDQEMGRRKFGMVRHDSEELHLASVTE